MTMLDMEIPKTDRKMEQRRKDEGIANPTSRADLNPSDAKMTIMTKATAVRTAPSSREIMPCV